MNQLKYIADYVNFFSTILLEDSGRESKNIYNNFYFHLELTQKHIMLYISYPIKFLEKPLRSELLSKYFLLNTE